MSYFKSEKSMTFYLKGDEEKNSLAVKKNLHDMLCSEFGRFRVDEFEGHISFTSTPFKPGDLGHIDWGEVKIQREQNFYLLNYKIVFKRIYLFPVAIMSLLSVLIVSYNIRPIYFLVVAAIAVIYNEYIKILRNGSDSSLRHLITTAIMKSGGMLGK